MAKVQPCEITCPPDLAWLFETERDFDTRNPESEGRFLTHLDRLTRRTFRLVDRDFGPIWEATERDDVLKLTRRWRVECPLPTVARVSFRVCVDGQVIAQRFRSRDLRTDRGPIALAIEVWEAFKQMQR